MCRLSLRGVEKLSADPEAMLVAAIDAMQAVCAGWKRLSELRTTAAIDLVTPTAWPTRTLLGSPA